MDFARRYTMFPEPNRFCLLHKGGGWFRNVHTMFLSAESSPKAG